MTDIAQQLRIVEALLFASAAPLDEASVASRLPEGADIGALMADLRMQFEGRGVNLVTVNGRWMLRTAADVALHLRTERTVPRKLSRAALETLAIIAYHQPITRAEIEDIRGVQVSKGTVDTLLEAGWVRPGKRRESPGRPLTWMTTDDFLVHFGLEGLEALPGVDELKAAGLLDKRPALAAIGVHPGGGAGAEDARPALPEEHEHDLDTADGSPDPTRD
ncbi:MAG: SMC-Scp complex subunit ScpB [Alphaproteobacteria bacterium]